MRSTIEAGFFPSSFFIRPRTTILNTFCFPFSPFNLFPFLLSAAFFLSRILLLCARGRRAPIHLRTITITTTNHHHHHKKRNGLRAKRRRRSVWAFFFFSAWVLSY